MTDTYPLEHAGPPADPPAPVDPATLDAWRVWEADQSPALDAGPLVAAAGPWRMAGCLMQLLAEADAANPRRDKTSDGGIGDARHAGIVSDHNPDAAGVVRARDFDVDGLDVPGAFERARRAAAAGKLPQLTGGGYLIHAGRITAPDFSGWLEYTGTNPHVTHGHVSCTRDPKRYDDRAPWGIWTVTKPPAKATTPPAQVKPTGDGWTGPDATGSGLAFRADIGDNGPRIKALQAFLARYAPAYARGLSADGWYGERTAAVIAEFARRSAIRGADGRNVGPQIARKLTVAGFRG